MKYHFQGSDMDHPDSDYSEEDFYFRHQDYLRRQRRIRNVRKTIEGEMENRSLDPQQEQPCHG